MRVTGLEPAHLSAQEPKSCVSANFTTPASLFFVSLLSTFIVYHITLEKSRVFSIFFKFYLNFTKCTQIV